MRLIILSKSFYNRYPITKYPEIMDKENRPYYCIEVKVEGRTYAIPIRHHINHPLAFFTVGDAGLDYTKAVVISGPDDISIDKPRISTEEWNIIKSGEDTIFHEFRKYLRQYRRAMKYPDNPRSSIFIRYSALQYFDIGNE